MLKLLTKQNIWNTWRVGVAILIGWIAFSPDTLYLSTIGSTWFIIGCPRTAYDLSYGVEIHAAQTYDKFLDNNEDERIEEIMEDELKHAYELLNAIELLK